MTTFGDARRLIVCAGIAVLALGTSAPAAAAPARQFAYFAPVGDGITRALLVERLSATRARVATSLGAQLGTVASDATQTVITLDAVLSREEVGPHVDSCGEQPPQRNDLAQIIVRNTSGAANRGVSQIVFVGTLTVLSGCDSGQVRPYYQSTTVNRVAMSARPSVHDLRPGTKVAGFSEQVWGPADDHFLKQDVVTLRSGGVASFATTGNTFPAQFNEELWLVFTFGGFQRAYTRVDIDDATGVETWLRAEWSGGQPQRLSHDRFVKPAAPAGFGNLAQASRVWESGLVVASPMPFFFNFYMDGTGHRITTEPSDGTQFRSPITWTFAGNNIVQTRFIGAVRADRTWVPLRNKGKVRFVMEDESRTHPDGTVVPFIESRVNFYVDRGDAVAPTNALGSSSSADAKVRRGEVAR